MNNEENIKPCPFCGSKAVLKEYVSESCVDIPFPYYYVKCTSNNCGANIGVSTMSRKEAIKYWNKRKG